MNVKNYFNKNNPSLEDLLENQGLSSEELDLLSLGEGSGDILHIRDILLKGCNNIRDYTIRRDFYGYLNSDGSDEGEPVTSVIGDRVDGSYHFDPEEGDSLLTESFSRLYKDLHIGMKDLSKDTRSIFSYLEVDMHKPSPLI